jgi:hypothetical protein
MITDSLTVPSKDFYIDSTPIQTYIIEIVKSLIKTNSSLTPELTITHTAPSPADYALQDLVSGGYGFATKNEGNSLLEAFVNAQIRIAELEEKLTALEILEG